MALTRCLPILLLVAMTATACASEDRADSYLTECYLPPTPTADDGGAFRGNLLYLLDALPSAAAPTGFASLQSGRAVTDRVLVCGLCIGDSAPEPCHHCLYNAGKKITEQCGDASRHAVFWDGHYFLGYADGANSSAGADADVSAVVFSGDAIPSPDVVSVQRVVALAQSLAPWAAKGSVATADATAGDRTVRVLAMCARDRPVVHCQGCLRKASLAVAKTWEVDGGVHGRVATVLGSNCYLLLEISTPSPPNIGRMIKDNRLLTALLAFEIVLLIVFAWRNNNRNASAAASPAMGMSAIKTMK